LLIGDGLTIGFEPNGYQLIASNIVNYAFTSSITPPNGCAIFETRDPWGFTVVKDAITAAGHTYSVFTPGEWAGSDFSQYRVVILNWDDTFVGDVLCPYTTALPDSCIEVAPDAEAAFIAQLKTMLARDFAGSPRAVAICRSLKSYFKKLDFS
jgi:hypothetical protein